jgi:hypothetical protein|tara:strand:+ start:218 stop:418 length:201 start_codon:yes stop_codon:yes gene_type:complete
MNNYAFMTEDGWKVEVDASTPQSGYNKLNAIPYFRTRGITRHYYKFGKDGFVANYDVRYLKEAGNE